MHEAGMYICTSTSYMFRQSSPGQVNAMDEVGPCLLLLQHPHQGGRAGTRPEVGVPHLHPLPRLQSTLLILFESLFLSEQIRS